MSTKSSIYMDDTLGVHIYHEMYDDLVHIETWREPVVVNIALPAKAVAALVKWVAAQPVDE